MNNVNPFYNLQTQLLFSHCQVGAKLLDWPLVNGLASFRHLSAGDAGINIISGKSISL